MAEPPPNAVDDERAPAAPSSEAAGEERAPAAPSSEAAGDERASAAPSNEAAGEERASAAPSSEPAGKEGASAAPSSEAAGEESAPAAPSSEAAVEAIGAPAGEEPVEPTPAPAPLLPPYKPWVTIVLAAANILVWLITLGLGASILEPSPEWMFEHGGNAGVATLGGEQWRLFTSMFLHYGVLHIGMNMVGLIGGGRLVERLYGRLGFAALYLVSGLAASLVSSLRTGVVSAGASGAIFGVLGALGAYYVLHRKRMDASVASESAGLMIFVGYNLLMGFQDEGIDMYAHVGGLGVGVTLGLALEVGRSPSASRLPRTILVAVLGLGAVLAGAVLAPAPGSTDRAVIEDLAATEKKILERWVELTREARQLGEDQLAGAIESELLPRWRAMREVFERSDAGAELRAELLEYLRAREEGWELMARGLRARDGEEVQRGLKRFEEAAVPTPEPAPR